jgi:hypothetical protein
MAKTVFKGAIGAGAFEAKFLSDFSNRDSDLLTIGYAEIGGGNAQVSMAAASPGGFAKVSLAVEKTGVLEIMVATGHADESGRIEVTRNGAPLDEDVVEDSIRWIYSVQP